MLENYCTLKGSGSTAADLVVLLAVSGTGATSLLSSSLSPISMMSLTSAPSLEDFFFCPLWLWSSFLFRFMDTSGFELVAEGSPNPLPLAGFLVPHPL